jgi:hypothetical protein
MAIKITAKETKFLIKILSKSINDIDTLYKFEGYIVGMICSEDMIPASLLMKDMFGDPDDENTMSWDSVDQLNQFMEIYSKINNKNASKLNSHIYRPIFAKTKDQVKEYAYGFRASYSSSLIHEDGDYDANLAYMIICSIYQANEEMCKDDSDYAKLIDVIDKKTLLMLSKSVQDLNQLRLESYVAPHDVKNNVMDFDDLSNIRH